MKFLWATFAFAAMVLGTAAHAECRKTGPDDLDLWYEADLAGNLVYYSQRQVNFGAALIEVDSTLPVGSTIVTGSTQPDVATYVVLCSDNVGTVNYELLNAPNATSQQTYDTGVPGIGYRLSYVRASGTTSTFPFSINWTANRQEFLAVGASAVFQIELVKTGPLQSESTVNLGMVGRLAGGGDGLTVLDITAAPVTLRVLPHCQVTSDKSLLVDFGPFGPRDVSTTDGPNKPVVIDIACDGPTPPDTVSATLMAQPAPEVTDFIKNDGTATGLAIRLLDTATNKVLKPQDPNSVASKSSPGFNASFELQATVLRVGGAAPTAGSIDAQAVVTLTFL